MERKTRLLVSLIAAGLVEMLVPIRAGANTGMAFDRSGNLFIAEPFGHKIFKFAADGSTSTFATGVEEPVAFDASGNLFAVDGTTGTILKLSPDGTRSTFASKVGVPSSLAFDAAGNLFVSEYNTGSIFKFTPTAKKSTFAEGKKHIIILLACDQAGNLFAADSDSDSIFKFTPDGVTSTFATQIKVSDLVISAAGDLFTVSYGSPTIFKFTPDGTRSKLETKLSRPQSLACDPAGNLFVYDSEDPGKIVKLSLDGIVSTFAQKQERQPARSVSPDGKWEFRSEDRGRFVVARVGSREMSVELSGALGTFANYSNIVWSPDTKRFAFNYQEGTRYQTTKLYQLNGDKWQELDSPESDATGTPLQRSIAAQKKKLQVSPDRRGRPIMTTYQIRKWIDASTALLYAHSDETFQVGNETEDVGASFFFTLKLDPAGKWKIARTREVPAKGVGGLNKIEQEEAKRIEETPEETQADKMEWRQSR
jgi:sugar lactone lactonase YvrE